MFGTYHQEVTVGSFLLSLFAKDFDNKRETKNKKRGNFTWKKIKSLAPKLRNKKRKGATMLEYALLAALIAVVAIAAVTFLGRQASLTFSDIGQHMGDVR
jgi:pilus assembly protein Flp/PilA